MLISLSSAKSERRRTMTQNDQDYVVHVHQSEDPPVIMYALFVIAVTWILAVVYAIMF